MICRSREARDVQVLIVIGPIQTVWLETTQIYGPRASVTCRDNLNVSIFGISRNRGNAQTIGRKAPAAVFIVSGICLRYRIAATL